MREKDSKLNIIKGVATFSVCSGHILDRLVYYRIDYQQEFVNVLYKNVPISWLFLTAGGIGVIFFCLLSGMFCCKKNIDSLKGFFIKAFHRYIDFFLLLLICNLIMWLCSQLGLFNNHGNWLLSHTHKELYPDLHILKGIEMALRIESWNGAMWMIKYLLFGNIIVYLYSYLKSIIHDKWIQFLVYIIMLIGAWFIAPLTYVTVAGVMFRHFFLWGIKVFNDINNCSERYIYRFIILITMVGFLNILTIGIQSPVFGIPYYVFTMPFAFIMIMVEYEILTLLGSKTENLLNRISNYQMSMFCVHIPIIYTFGGLIYGLTAHSFEKEIIHIVFVYIFIIVVVVIISYFYERFIEQARKKIVKMLFSKVYNI